jgi:hypothetical protein
MTSTTQENQKNHATPTNAASFEVSTGALPASRKIYVEGKLGTKVAMREISLHDKDQPTFTVYDTSGPYTDENVQIDIRKGLPKLRNEWIKARGDVESYQGREVKAEDNGFKEWQLAGQEQNLSQWESSQSEDNALGDVGEGQESGSANPHPKSKISTPDQAGGRLSPNGRGN